MAQDWSGYFINLDRATGRREALETALKKSGLTAYRRFPAIDGSTLPPAGKLVPGVVGCFHSHHRLLSAVPGDGRPIHVLEDDAVVSKEFAPALQKAISGGRLAPFDLVFTDVFIPDDLHLIRLLKGMYDKYTADGTLQLLNLQQVPFACTSSYVVNPQSVERVRSLLEAELVRGPTLPVDLYLRQLAHAGTLKVGCLFPFLTCVAPLESTVGEYGVRDAASILLRQAFYVGADVAAVRRLIRQLAKSTGPSKFDAQLDLLGELLRFYVSDKFR